MSAALGVAIPAALAAAAVLASACASWISPVRNACKSDDSVGTTRSTTLLQCCADLL